jgi:uncharacterized protein
LINKLATLARFPVPIRILAFALVLGVIWLVAYFSLSRFWAGANFVLPVSMVLLYTGFVFLLRIWGQRLYAQTRPLKFYGWDFSWRGSWELSLGLSVGLAMLMLLFVLEGLLGWVSWLPVSAALGRVIAEGLLLGLVVGCAEELLFRGWLLQELDQDYPPVAAMITSSLIFALLHFLKPLEEILNTWTQGLGLLILGMLLVWARRLCRGRLGLAIGLHGGLVWGYYIIRVGELVRYPGTVPVWVTGINHNPLAGLAGLVLISLLAAMVGILWRQQSLRRSPKLG